MGQEASKQARMPTKKTAFLLTAALLAQGAKATGQNVDNQCGRILTPGEHEVLFEKSLICDVRDDCNYTEICTDLTTYQHQDEKIVQSDATKRGKNTAKTKGKKKVINDIVKLLKTSLQKKADETNCGFFSSCTPKQFHDRKIKQVNQITGKIIDAHISDSQMQFLFISSMTIDTLRNNPMFLRALKEGSIKEVVTSEILKICASTGAGKETQKRVKESLLHIIEKDPTLLSSSKELQHYPTHEGFIQYYRHIVRSQLADFNNSSIKDLQSLASLYLALSGKEIIEKMDEKGKKKNIEEKFFGKPAHKLASSEILKDYLTNIYNKKVDRDREILAGFLINFKDHFSSVYVNTKTLMKLLDEENSKKLIKTIKQFNENWSQSFIEGIKKDYKTYAEMYGEFAVNASIGALILGAMYYGSPLLFSILKLFCSRYNRDIDGVPDKDTRSSKRYGPFWVRVTLNKKNREQYIYAQIFDKHFHRVLMTGLYNGSNRKIDSKEGREYKKVISERDKQKQYYFNENGEKIPLPYRQFIDE